MKLIRVFIFISLFLMSAGIALAQQIKNYDPQWKIVNELFEQKNLPKSALEEVKKIYALAKKDGQKAQIIKSLVYQSRTTKPDKGR
jgi:uncharacterized protein (DUF2384 family)